MDKRILFIILGIVLAGVLFWVWRSGILIESKIHPEPTPEDAVLFYGSDCPHCQNVEKFIDDNKIEEKIKIKRLEIPFNGKTNSELQANLLLLAAAAGSCELDTSQGIAIPFLYKPSGEAGGNGNCLVGDESVINFLKNEAKIQ